LFAGAVSVVVFAWFYRYLLKNVGEIGETAPRNPWKANTLEWVAPVIPPHGNFGLILPVVQRGPYEYSAPGEEEDWAPRTRPLSEEAAAAAH
jgi:cytochrome c oxidase subunit 1